MLAILGAAVVFLRTGITFNRHTRTITTWTKCLFVSKHKDLPLSNFEHISLRRECRSVGESGSKEVFAVQLNDGPLVKDHSTYQEARKDGKELARFLGMPLSDSTSGETVLRAPDELDAPLRDRLRKQGTTPEKPVLPVGMRSTCDVEGNLLRINIPSQNPLISTFDIGLIVFMLSRLFYLMFLQRRE